MSHPRTSHLYRVYGMNVASEMELPELLSVTPQYEPANGSADVRIEFGSVIEGFPGYEQSDSWAQSFNGECLLKIKGAGRFLVSHGSRVIIEKETNASFDDLRTWLLGSVLAAVAHQRRLIPLHISAVLSPHGAIAFTGDSGAGKSTIAAHINESLGWPLISDDVSCLYQEQDLFLVESGVHTVKLWTDALDSLDRSSVGLKRDLLRQDKFHALDSSKFVSGRFPLTKLIRLGWGADLTIDVLVGRRAFEATIGAIYRPELAQICGNRAIIDGAMALAQGIDVFQLWRPQHRQVAAEVPKTIEALLTELDVEKG